MSELWLLVVVAAPLLALWSASVVEVLRRADLSTAGKAGWCAALVVGGVFGLAAYLVARPPRAIRTSRSGTPGASRAEAIVVAAERRQRGEMDDHAYRSEVERIAVIE